MSRDMKTKRAPAKKKSAGGTLIGLFVGLVLGIVGAAAVVWYINKMPTPFSKSATPGGDKDAARPAQPPPTTATRGRALSRTPRFSTPATACESASATAVGSALSRRRRGGFRPA